MKLTPLEKIDLLRARLHRLFKDLEDVGDTFGVLTETKKELLRLVEICEPQK
jgi:hypothetical protein